MEPIETVEYKGHVIKVYPDDDPMNPRDYDNLGVMVCWHRRYQLGDKHEWKTPADFNESDEGKHAAIILPLYLYDHSGLRIKVGSFAGLLSQGHAEFDSGQVGYIYVTREQVKKEYSKITKATKAKAQAVLEEEVKTYDLYLRGGFVGYTIEGPHCDDSCWGFDDVEYMVNEAKALIDAGFVKQ